MHQESWPVKHRSRNCLSRCISLYKFRHQTRYSARQKRDSMETTLAPPKTSAPGLVRSQQTNHSAPYPIQNWQETAISPRQKLTLAPLILGKRFISGWNNRRRKAVQRKRMNKTIRLSQSQMDKKHNKTPHKTKRISHVYRLTKWTPTMRHKHPLTTTTPNSLRHERRHQNTVLPCQWLPNWANNHHDIKEGKVKRWTQPKHPDTCSMINLEQSQLD